MTVDIRKQLIEALDEAEEIARQAASVGNDTWEPGDLDEYSTWKLGDRSTIALEERYHIARWDPSTVLRLIGSHRELIAALDLAQADMDAKVRTFDNYGTGELIAATARCKALREEVDRAAAFWLGTPEVDRG